MTDFLYIQGHHELEDAHAKQSLQGGTSSFGEKIKGKNLEEKMEAKNVKELFEKGIISLALLPEKNDYLLTDEGKELRKKLLEENNPEKLKKYHENGNENVKYIDLKKLEQLNGYTVPLTIHDYGAKTPLMWNTVYEENKINIRNFMVVANPSDLGKIIPAFENDEKYLGGGMAVGFKEKIISYLDEIKQKDLKSVNIIYKKQGRLIGQNTDSTGFIKSLEDRLAKNGKKVEGSNIVVLGAGGVAKEISRLLAEKKAGRITIINRTYAKAVELANELNKTYGHIALGAGEDLTRGILLNSFVKPDAVINLTDKGSDSMPDASAFAPSGEHNHTIARGILEKLYLLYPEIIIADIVLPSCGRSITLRHSEYYGFKNLLDGIPMVINQGAPAYKLVEENHKEKHEKIIDEEKVLEIMRRAAQGKKQIN